MTDFIVSFFLFLSGLFILLAAIGLKRFPDLFCRMHATCKASTLAKMFSFAGAGIYFWDTGNSITVKAICVLIFLFVTTPVSAHLIARAGYKRGAKPCKLTWHDDYSKES